MIRHIRRLSLRPVLAAPRVVKLLSLEQFCEGFVPIGALYAIMFDRVGHLDLRQIGWLFSIWALVYVLAELPSGVLADYWSRRKVIIVGGLVRAAGFAAWIAWPGFAGYALGFALWGIAIACSSGSVAAYLHDELRADGLEKHYARYFGWVMASLSAGSLAGYAVAAVLTLRHADLLSGLAAASSVIICLLLLPAAERPYDRQDSYLRTLSAGVSEIRRSRRLRYVCFILFSAYMIIGVLEELLPRLYSAFGMNDHIVAILSAAALLVSIFLLARLEDVVRISLAKQVLLMAAGLVPLLAGLMIGGFAGSLLVLAFSLVFQLFRSVFIHHVQAEARPDVRATIASVPGLVDGLLSAGSYAVIGAVAARTSERLSIGLYGAVWLAILLAAAAAGRRFGSSKTAASMPAALAAAAPHTQP